MAYIGFDLDETLGRFNTPYFYTIFLQPHTVLYRGEWSGVYDRHKYVQEPIPLSPGLENKLNKAFTIFAECLASKEPALGLLRPSMIEIARRLYELKQEGLVKAVVIYSNNGNLALLHLAAKMIEILANAPGLFCNYIHWYHPSRSMEIEKKTAGVGYKTLAVLKEAFKNGSCKITEEIPDNNIYFFDDAVPIHFDLQSKIAHRYFRIAPYKYDAEFSKIDECFKKTFNESRLLEDEEYKQYISPILPNNTTFHGMMQYISNDKVSFLRKTLKPDDTKLLEHVMTIFPKPTTKNNFTKSVQRLRHLEKKQNEGAPLTSEEEHALKTSHNIITSYEAQHPNISGGRRRTKKRSSKKSKTQRRRRNN